MAKIALDIDGNIGSFTRWRIELAIQYAKQTGQKQLPIKINSYGGSAYEMRTIVDLLKKSDLEIITICSGVAMSAAVGLLVMGSKRYAYPSSTIMIHQASSYTLSEGITKTTTSDAKSNADELSRLTDDYYKLIDSQISKSSGFIKDLVLKNGNTDLFLAAEKAKEYNLIQIIGMPDYKDIFPSDALNQNESIYELSKDFNTEIKKEIKKNPGFFADFKNDDDFCLFYSKNFNFMEVNPTMSSQNVPAVQNVHSLTTNQSFSLNDVQKMLNDGLESQKNVFEKQLEESNQKAKEEAKKELDAKYQSEFVSLNEKITQLTASESATKTENEKLEVKMKLKDLHENQNKITYAELESEEEFILKYTKVEDGSRAAYFTKLSNRPVNIAMSKKPLLDNTESNKIFSDKERNYLEDGGDKKQAQLSAFMRTYLSDNKLDPKNHNHISLARREGLKKFPELMPF